VEKRTVLLGLEGESSFEAKEGLTVGETIVTEGKSSLSSGDSVKVVKEEKEAVE
jgi:hypothetical protein